MNKIYLITGGNIDNRKQSLDQAALLISAQIGKIIRKSKIYVTDPWGITEQNSFYNQVLIVESNYSAEEVMQKILGIEEEMGRVRTIKNAARIIDIDILFFNDEIINKRNLVVPHPLINNRLFVLIPLNELAPDLIHPVFKKSIKDLLVRCEDKLKVSPLPFK